VADYKEHAKEAQKSIWFAVNQAHAGTLTRMLNQAYPTYNGKYAELIDYTVDNAADIIKRFKRDELPKALVSVDMLTT
jgi:type I restriction enzyme R subunit